MDDILLPKNAIQIVRGASKTLQLAVVGPECKPYNLTGGTLLMTVKDRVEDLNNVFQKSSANSSEILITDYYGGLANIFIQPVDTQNRDVREYVFDVWLLIGGNQFVVIPPSIFDIQAAVTRFV